MGVLGINTDLPFNDFLHSGGNRTAAFFEATESGIIYQMGVRLRSASDASNEAMVGIYDKTGSDSGNNLTLSTDVKPFGTSLSTLLFDIEKEIVPTTKYILAVQGKSDYYFVYDNLAQPGFMFLNNAAFGTFDSSFTGVGVFDNTITIWADYLTPSGVKKRILLTGVGH